jgi:predicted kinase
MINKAILFIGLPGAGKTTEARRNYSDYYIVSADEIKETHPDYNPADPEPLHQWSVKEAETMMEHLSDNDVHICMDSGGINNSYSLRIIRMLKSKGYHVTLIHFDTPLNICIKRNRERERKVPEYAIIQKAEMLQTCLEKQMELVDDYKKIVYKSPMSHIVKGLLGKINKTITYGRQRKLHLNKTL